MYISFHVCYIRFWRLCEESVLESSCFLFHGLRCCCSITGSKCRCEPTLADVATVPCPLCLSSYATGALFDHLLNPLTMGLAERALDEPVLDVPDLLVT